MPAVPSWVRHLVAQALACDFLAYKEPSILLRYINQPFPYGVVLDVLNLFLQLLFMSDDVIETLIHPYRSTSLQHDVDLPSRRSLNFSEYIAEVAFENPENQMGMIWHHDRSLKFNAITVAALDDQHHLISCGRRKNQPGTAAKSDKVGGMGNFKVRQIATSVCQAVRFPRIYGLETRDL